MLKSIGEHKATNRELFAVHLNSASDLSDTIDISSEYFVCFLCWDSQDIESDVIANVAEILLKSGGVYFCIWGSDSKRIHDIIDDVSVDRGSGKEFVIMTTSHENESLDDALWFFLNTTLPDDKFIDGCRAGLAVSISISDDRKERIDYALTHSSEFDEQVLIRDKAAVRINEGTWSKSIDAILSVGRWMGESNDYNWALTREQALNALDQLENEGIGVLGGDVLELREGILKYNYDNWHCDPEENEADSAFTKRSISRAKTYITEYQPTEYGYFFSIVPETKRRLQGPNIEGDV